MSSLRIHIQAKFAIVTKTSLSESTRIKSNSIKFEIELNLNLVNLWLKVEIIENLQQKLQIAVLKII